MRATPLCAFLTLLGCGTGGTQLPPECTDSVFPTLPEPSGAVLDDAAGRIAVLVVEQVEDTVNDQRSGSYRMFFLDFTDYEGRAAPIDFDSDNCWRVVGQPVITVQATDLTVAGVVVGGLSGGDETVGDVQGSHLSTPVAEVFSSSDLSLHSEAVTTGDPTFPTIDVSVAPPAPIEGVTTEVPDIGGEMLLRWTPGESSWMDIELVTDDPNDPGSATTRNRVVCRVRDDGCHQIPAFSLDWLSLNGFEAKLRLERHRVSRHAPEPSALATLDTVQKRTSEIDLTDGSSL